MIHQLRYAGPGWLSVAGILLASFLVLFGGCQASETGETGDSPRVEEKVAPSGEISTEELVAAIERGDNLLLLDVRTPGEFESGHIEGAVLIPSYALAKRVGELEEYRDRTIVPYCEVGGRAGAVVGLLKENGFQVRLYRPGMSVWRTLP
jgi:rhodanese-related sulfurtransferase